MIKQIQEINFPNYATLSQATITLNDMGDKTISTQVKIDGSIIPDFSYDWEVEFKGERYIHPLRQPQAGKSNDSISSKIDLVFQHKTIYELKRYYFVEMTSTMSGTAIADQYIASLGLNLPDFCVAFQRVLDHYFNGAITIDLNPNIEYTKGVQFMSISYSYIWDVLQKVYEVYGVRWTIEGNTIKVGYPSTIVSHTFQYGYEGGLLQVERQVQDANIRNSLLGRGGEQNLPAYYFKEAPEGSLFASDPDAIPELANVYFSNLRGKTFRDYVKGWKAKHYGGAPMSEPTDAYTKGYTDTKFNPIEYVEDKESIEKYGLLQGGLDNNEEIYPSIQGAPNGEDVVVYVEPVTTDEVAESVRKESVITNIEPSYITISMPQNSTSGRHKLSVDFEVPEGKVGYLSYNIVLLDAINKGNDITDNIIFLRKEFTVQNLDTFEKVDSTYYETGKYRYTIDFTLKSESNYAGTIKATVGIEQGYIEVFDSTDNSDKWLPTFNIWVKNIWHSTRNVGENDLEYAERVWRPILGDRQGNEAKVVFSSGWLSGHEDYEFTIVDFAYDNSHEDSEWRLTLAKSDAELEATGKYIPSASTNGQAYAGDTFFFIGIDMPYQYVLWGEERVDNWKKGELYKTSEIQPKWVVRLDKLRLNEENDNLVEQIKEGNAINLADVRFIDAPALQLYLQSVTYTWNEQTLLYPDIEVVLADTIVPVQNPVAQLQGSIETINSQLANIGNVAQVVRKIGDSLYLRKDGVADISKSPTKFVGNVSGNNFRQGKVGGADWGIYRDENGNAIAEFDKIIARKDLEVNNLVINQVSYVGGMQITSAASVEITRVIENDNAYQCFFDQKGGSIANLFVVNDIAYSQRFDEENNTTKYYKRVVTEVGVDYITLSKSQVDGVGVPMPNDVVIHYGNTTDTNRQYVIIRDVIGGGYERMLSDLNSVSSSGVEYYFAGRMEGNTPRWFVGNNNQFIEYKDGHLQIKADVTIGANSDLSASEEFKKLQDDIKGLQNQIDGKVEAFFYNYDPKLDNLPASEWTTDAIKEEHLNDTFTNIESGQSWRWLLKDGVYQWVAISDTQALQMAQDALNLANSKVTIFTETPIPPYKVKDLWFQGEGGNTMRCVKARNEQESFNASDWVKADDYKDFASSVAGDAEQNAKNYADSQISSYDLTIKYLKDAFNKGSVLDVNGVTLSALVGVKDKDGKVVAGLYGGGSDKLNAEGYADSTHGAMLLFGGIEGVDKPKTYKTAIFEDGFLQSTYFATAKEGKRVEIFGNELKVYGDDANNSVLSISYDSTGKPRLQYTDKSGNVAWYLSDSGISTSYTVKQVDDLLAKYILKDTAQTISARHNFSDGLQIGGITIRKSQDGTVYIDGNLVIKGALTMFGTDATIPSSIWANIPFNPEQMSWDGSQWNISGGGSGSVDDAKVNVLISEYLAKNSYATQLWVQNQGYLTTHQSISHLLSKTDAANTYQPIINSSNKLAYSLISGTPDLNVYFRSSDFTKANIKSTLGISDWALAATKPSYTAAEVGALSLSGGILNGRINFRGGVTIDYESSALSIKTSAGASYIGMMNESFCHIYTDAPAFYMDKPLFVDNGKTVIHSGNIGEYKAGSADNANLLQGRSIALGNQPFGMIVAVNDEGWSEIGAHLEFHFDNTSNIDFSTVLRCTGNHQNIVDLPSRTGTIALTDSNVASATKLQTARTIWGQSFDGTDNVTHGFRSCYAGSYNGGVAHSILNSNDPYGLITRINGNGSVSLQAQREANDAQCFDLIFNPLGGNVLVGSVATPKAKLHVGGTALIEREYPSGEQTLGTLYGLGVGSKNYGISMWTEGSGSGYIQQMRFDGEAATYNLCLQPFGGNVAIGGTTASTKLHVYGDILATGAITMFSQLSMKNVIDYNGLSLAQLAQIKPARFTWKDGRDNRIHVGGIADEVMQILPEVIYRTSDDKLTMDYGSAGFFMSASLIKPVIDHEKRIKELEARVEYLKNENERLQQRIA